MSNSIRGEGLALSDPHPPVSNKEKTGAMLNKPWLKHYEQGVPHSVNYPNKTIGEILHDVAHIYPHHTATNFILKYVAGVPIGGKLSYHTLYHHCNCFANALSNIGVRKNDRVALLLPNSPHFLIAFFAAMQIGAIVVAINPTYTSHELSFQLQDSGAETIILLNRFWKQLEGIYHQSPIKRVIVADISDTLPFHSRLLTTIAQRKSGETRSSYTTGVWNRKSPPLQSPHRSIWNIYSFKHLLQKYDATPPAISLQPEDIALFQYTGGTTGTPKAAQLTHRNIVANTLQINAWFAGHQPGKEKVLSAIPFFHAYGLNVGMLQGLSIGAQLVIVPNPRPIENLLKIIHKERCTLFPGVPAMYIAVINHPNIQRYDLSSVRACLSGSAPLPAEVQQRFERITGGKLVEGYGLSEASPATHCNPLNGTRKAGSIGIPLPDVEAKLVDIETGEDLPFGDGNIGEMFVRGPQIMLGYWQREDETAIALNKGQWLRTGDICTVDEDGFFTLVDRKKDMIIVKGLKVLPREVEEILYLHPAVKDAVVVGIPNYERGDERVKAYIVTHGGHHPDIDAIQAFCAQYLAPYKIPRDIDVRNELPRNLVGKVLRRVLVEEETRKQAKPANISLHRHRQYRHH